MNGKQLTFPGMLPDDIYRRAARNDPETSHQAAEHVRDSGIAARQASVVLEAVKKWPGKTSAELAANMFAVWKMPNQRHVVARRLPELLAAGKVQRSGTRLCGVNKRQAMTWEPA